MRFIDEIEILKRKVHGIDELMHGAQWKPAEVDIIEASFWARSVLEIVEKVDFSRYGHSLKTTIRATHSVSDPDHPGSIKVVYKQNQNVSLKHLLGIIIHFRYFSFDRFADGDNYLEVMSDQEVIQQVYYSDFTAALRSLVLSKRLVGRAILDMVEQDLLRRAKESWKHSDALIFPSINFISLLQEHMKSETTLKLSIMDEMFGIDTVPDEVLPELAFFPCQFGPGEEMVIGFGPPWENDQSVFSPSFDQALLFNLIRRFYAGV